MGADLCGFTDDSYYLRIRKRLDAENQGSPHNENERCRDSENHYILLAGSLSIGFDSFEHEHQSLARNMADTGSAMTKTP